MISVYFHLCWELKSSIALTSYLKNCLISLYIYCFLWYKSTLHTLFAKWTIQRTLGIIAVFCFELFTVCTRSPEWSLSFLYLHATVLGLMSYFPFQPAILSSRRRRLSTMGLCNQCGFFNSHLSSWSHSLLHLLPGLHLLNKLWPF